jgi:hypothetical protein
VHGTGRFFKKFTAGELQEKNVIETGRLSEKYGPFFVSRIRPFSLG